MNTGSSHCEMRNGFRVFRQRTVEAEAVLNELLPDPDVALLSGEICKPGSRTHGALVVLGGKRYFLKRYNCRGILYRIRNTFRYSRAVYTWRLAWGFLLRGVPVPEPLLCLEERSCRLLGRSYVLMEAASGQCLTTLWPTLTYARRLSILQHLGCHLGRMHREGCLHGDLKWSNILVEDSDGKTNVCLVDLDGGRQLGFPVLRLADKDLNRFLKDLHQFGDDPSLEKTFKQSWLAGWHDQPYED